MLGLLEDFCDLFVRRFAAEGTSTRAYTPQEFAEVAERLRQTQQLQVRRRQDDEIVLIAPGKRFCNLRTAVPRLRYRLRWNAEGRIHVTVFEHVLCFANSPQAKAMQGLCDQQLTHLLSLVDGQPETSPPTADFIR